ncbi:MAG TPA: class I SAM-dependent methyltransferase [Polyangiaceae bacterium]
MKDWDAFWALDAETLSVGPSTMSRLRVVMPLLRRYARPGASLLDVGCGTGLLLAKAAGLGTFGRLVGIDVSERPLALAKRACPSARFVVTDVCQAPLDERFDLVTSMMTLDLVPDEESAARNVAAMVEPGGHLIVVVQHRAEYGSELDRRYGVRRHDAASLAARFAPHGLEPVRMFSWGWPLFHLYYGLLDKSGAGVTGSGAVSTPLRRVASLCLPLVFRFDDVFTWTNRGRVLFGVFRKPAARHAAP